MCKNSINRRNVLRAIKAGGVTGVTIPDCAVSVIAVMDLDPSCRAKVEDIIVKLVFGGEVYIQDAVLRVRSHEDLERMREEERCSRIAKEQKRARASAHRSRGIRGLPLMVNDDPDWDPDEPATEELEYIAWVAESVTPPLANGWEEFDLAVTPAWDQSLLDACFPQERHSEPLFVA